MIIWNIIKGIFKFGFKVGVISVLILLGILALILI